jgi:signal transduction histidine kinase
MCQGRSPLGVSNGCPLAGFERTMPKNPIIHRRSFRCRAAGLMLMIAAAWPLTAQDASEAVPGSAQAAALGQIANLNATAARLARTDPDRARTIAEQALDEAAKAGDERGRIEALHNLGRIARLRGDLELASTRLREAQSVAKQIGDMRLLAKVNNALGITYELLGLDSEALDLHQQVLSLWQTLGDRAGEIASTINIGKVFEQRGDFDNARRQFERARDALGAYGSEVAVVPQDRAAVFAGLARAELQFGELDAALANVERALKIQRDSEDRIGEASSTALMAQVQARSGRVVQAFKSYEDALDIAAAVGSKPELADILGQMGRMHLAAALSDRPEHAGHRAEMLAEALEYSERALNLAQELGAPRNLMPLYQQIAEIHEARKDIAQALAAQKAYVRQSELRFEEQSQARYALLESRYHADEREREIGALRTQAELSERLIERERSFRRVLVLCILMALLLAALLGFRYWERVLVERRLRQARDTLRQALDDAESARKRAEEADRVKTEMLGIAAHDLRNPMSSILGFADLIRSEPESLANAKRHAGIIVNAAQRTLRLLTDLLESATLDTGRVELRLATLDFSELVAEAIERQRERAGAKQQQIEFSGAHNALVRADADRLHQIMDNLLSNAIKFSPAGSQIDVKVINAEQEVRVEVRDAGPGFREQDRNLLFKRFQRLSARPTGGESSTGLGLSIVRDLVTLHGGVVRADPAGDRKGSVFSVSLPQPGKPALNTR